MTTKSKIILASVVVSSLIMIKIYQGHELSNSLKNSMIIKGQVDSIERTRGVVYVHIQYLYKGKIMHNFFGTGDRQIIDSLKKDTRVLILVSKQYPSKYIKYIGVRDSTINDPD